MFDFCLSISIINLWLFNISWSFFFHCLLWNFKHKWYSTDVDMLWCHERRAILGFSEGLLQCLFPYLVSILIYNPVLTRNVFWGKSFPLINYRPNPCNILCQLYVEECKRVSCLYRRMGSWHLRNSFSVWKGQPSWRPSVLVHKNAVFSHLLPCRSVPPKLMLPEILSACQGSNPLRKAYLRSGNFLINIGI